MDKKIIMGLFAAGILFTGCGANTDTAVLDESAAQTEESSTTPTETPAGEKFQKPPAAQEIQERSASEKLALDYLNTYVNNADLAAKKKFVDEHIHPDVQTLFDSDKHLETEPELKVRHPVVVESVDYADQDGVQTDAVLLRGETRYRLYNEVIVLVADGKIKWATETSRGAEFKNIRSEFQTPVPAETTPPMTVLDELVNFVIVDVWNDGFAQFHYYALDGTNAYGEPMDSPAVMDHLAQMIVKKKKYDTYMETLDADYDEAKKAWTPLSQETDRLYARLQTTPPKPQDPDTDFDTEAFRQYRDNFQKVIDDMLLEIE